MVLCALGLAISPVAARAELAAPGAMSACALDGHMPARTADHSRMDCCTPACQASPAAALVPDGTADASLVPTAALHDRAGAKALASFTAGGPDPPPRATFS